MNTDNLFINPTKAFYRSIKLFLFVFIFNIIAFASFSQNIQADSLKKYSYLILTHANDVSKSGNGTGFFMRKKKKIYLITCYHVFTGLDDWSKKNKGPYDSITVRYYDLDNNIKYFSINTTTSHFIFKNFREDPDIYIYEIDPRLIKDAKIYSIENFIVSGAKPIEENEQIISFQFSSKKDGYIAQQVREILQKNSLSYDGKKIYGSPKSFEPEYNNLFSLSNRPVSSLDTLSSTLTLDTFSVSNILDKWNSLNLTNTKPPVDFFSAPSKLNAIFTNKEGFAFSNSESKEINNDLSVFLKNDYLPFLGNNTIKLNIFDSVYSKKNISLGNNIQNSPDSFLLLKPWDTDSLTDQIDIYNNSIFKLNNSYNFITDEKNKQSFSELVYNNQNDLFSNADIRLYRIGKTFLRNSDSLFSSYINNRLVNDLANLSENNSNQNLLLNFPRADELIYFKQDNFNLRHPASDDLQANKIKFLDPFISFIPPPLLDIFSQIDFNSFPHEYYYAQKNNKTEIIKNDPKLFEKYFVTTPASYPGGSGSPIFIKRSVLNKKKNVEKFEFIGMQCANLNYSNGESFGTVILKAEVIQNLYTLLK